MRQLTLVAGVLAASTSLVSAQDAFFECSGDGRQANVMAQVKVLPIGQVHSETMNANPHSSVPYISNLYSIGESNISNVGVRAGDNFDQMVTDAKQFCDDGSVSEHYKTPKNTQASYTTLDF